MSDLPETVTITRADLGRPVVAIRYDGPTVTVLADHNAPDWMITAATNLARLVAEQRRSA